MEVKQAGPAEYHTYTRKILAACRRIDTNPTDAQREAGNFAKAKIHIHGLPISLEFGRGSIRSGRGQDGKKWSRVVNAAGYGYIRGTEAEDGEHLDVWLGDHPESIVGFLINFLTSEGEHDEVKACLGVRNLAEAKALIASNYPDGFWDQRIGEVRGFLLPELRAKLKTLGIMKPTKKAAEAKPFWCKGCSTWIRYPKEDGGCPACEKDAD